MQLASQAFQRGDIDQSIVIYTEIIDNNQVNANQALLNRSSAYYSKGVYQQSMNDVKAYLQKMQAPSVQAYIILANTFIKLKKILSSGEYALLERGKKQYPLHKKYLDTMKTVEDIQITEDEDAYLNKIFQKLLSFPNFRNYMQEESFLTKVQKMIKNPSLAGVLIKMDNRLAQVQQIILMADN